MFTKKDIQNIANAQSYDRGESYFKSGYVRKLKFKDNTFEAKVHGSERYDVSITIDKKGDIESTYCDCPYDYDGDCKHIVAVGLAAIEYARQNHQDLAYTAFETVYETPKNLSFDQIFADTEAVQKILFLNQLLHKNIDLSNKT